MKLRKIKNKVTNFHYIYYITYNDEYVHGDGFVNIYLTKDFNNTQKFLTKKAAQEFINFLTSEEETNRKKKISKLQIHKKKVIA